MPFVSTTRSYAAFTTTRCYTEPASAAALSLAAAIGMASAAATAQAYPVRQIRIVVPFAPSGPNNILARVAGQKLTETWGQQVVVNQAASRIAHR